MAVAITDARAASGGHSWQRLMTDTLRIVLELELHADPVRGRVLSDGSQARRFDGYVQLIGLLEALRSDRGREAGDDPGRAT